MTTENQLGTLEEMTKESFVNRPNQSTEAVTEYLDNLKEENPEEAKLLEAKFSKDSKYLDQFKVAITHTSLMVFLASLKAANIAAELDKDGVSVAESINEIKVDFDQYVREYLFFARSDDKQIYTMRLFYLEGLTGSELGLDQINEDAFDSKEEIENAKKKSAIQLNSYDELLFKFKGQYIETKLHLQ